MLLVVLLLMMLLFVGHLISQPTSEPTSHHILSLSFHYPPASSSSLLPPPPPLCQIYPFSTGDRLDIYVSFSRKVAVMLPNHTLTTAVTGNSPTGTPGVPFGAPQLQMLLTQNVITKNLMPYAVYAGMGDNDTSVKFQYIVQLGDVAYPLQYNGIYALTGDIRLYSSRHSLIPATITLPPPSSLGSVSSCCNMLLNTGAPYVVSLFPLKVNKTNTPSPHTFSPRPINTPYQYSMSLHPITPPSHPTLSPPTPPLPLFTPSSYLPSP